MHNCILPNLSTPDSRNYPIFYPKDQVSFQQYFWNCGKTNTCTLFIQELSYWWTSIHQTVTAKTVIPSILFLIVVVVAIIALSKPTPNSGPANPTAGATTTPSSIVLFYGDGCPHCAIVEEYLNRNKVTEQVSFERKEVYRNKQHANELSQVAQACGFPLNEIGVPFLWDGQGCLVGDRDIISFFERQMQDNEND